MMGIIVAVAATSATFAYFEAERSVHVEIVPDDNELIDLVPLQPYAFIGTDGGTLVIELGKTNTKWPGNPDSPYFNQSWVGTEMGSGVSPDSIYVFEHVFGVSNHLWEGVPICMHITYGGTGGVTFFTGDYEGQTGETTLDVTIMPGEMVPIGMIINSTCIAADGDDITGELNFHATNGACG